MVVVVAGLALAACSSTPASSTAASAQASVAASGSPVASSAASSAASAAPSAGIVAVDLLFTGTLPVTAKGTAGQCMLGHSTADGSVLFGFGAVEADYPGLAQGLYLNEDPGSHRLILKWLAGGSYLVDQAEGQGFTYSSDHKSITLDLDLSTGSQPKEHLKGTISCP
jgi:guanyl-specific ribonuclease Sa